MAWLPRCASSSTWSELYGIALGLWLASSLPAVLVAFFVDSKVALQQLENGRLLPDYLQHWRSRCSRHNILWFRNPAQVGLFFSDWANHLAGQAHGQPPRAPDDFIAAAHHPPVAELSRHLLRAQSRCYATNLAQSATTSWYLDELNKLEIPIVFGVQATT